MLGPMAPMGPIMLRIEAGVKVVGSMFAIELDVDRRGRRIEDQVVRGSRLARDRGADHVRAGYDDRQRVEVYAGSEEARHSSLWRRSSATGRRSSLREFSSWQSRSRFDPSGFRI